MKALRLVLFVLVCGTASTVRLTASTHDGPAAGGGAVSAGRAPQEPAPSADAGKSKERSSVVNGAVGYTIVRYDEPEALPVGWYITVAAKPVWWFALVSELAGAYDSDNGSGTAQRSTIFFLNGPQVRFPVHRVTPFGEVLFGIAHDVDYRPLDTDKNRFVWRPGGGLDIRLSTNVSVRFQAGAILAADGDGPSVVQFTTGVVFGK